MPTGTSAYPASIDNLGTVKSDSDLIGQELVNASAAIENIEAELGTNPSGSSATVAARFGVIQDTSDVFTLTGTVTATALTAKTWAVTNVTTDRTFDANSYTTDELADALGTLAADYTALQNAFMSVVQHLKDRSIIG